MMGNQPHRAPGPRMWNLTRVKDHVRRRFEPGHPLREAILREPDELPIDDALFGRLQAYLNMSRFN